MQAQSFNLVILGGGLAGLAAGNRALELGLTVALVEQGEGAQYPCNSRFSGGILHLSFQDVKDSPESLRLAMSDATGGFADKEVAGALADAGARAVDWLQKEGAKFIRVGHVVWQHWVLAPPRPISPGLDWNGRGPDVTLRTLMDNFKRRGGQVFYSTLATGLIERAGGCVGLKVNSAGAERDIEGAAVLIADGGFQANLELLGKNISPQPQKVLQRGAGNARGAGLCMAQELGADVSDLSTFYGHLLVQDAFSNAKLWPYPQLDELATAGMIVNAAGHRVADEGMGGVNLANQIARRKDPLDCFVVFDEGIWQTAGTASRIPANPNLVRAGAKFISAASLEELAGLMKVPVAAFLDTVHTYNDAVDAGNTAQLAPPRTTAKYAPVKIIRGPFYALPVCSGITHTTGGILIDARARVRRKSGGTVPGLYAAGSAVGGIEGGPQAGYVGGLMKALVLGLIAAEDVAAQSR